MVHASASEQCGVLTIFRLFATARAHRNDPAVLGMVFPSLVLPSPVPARADACARGIDAKVKVSERTAQRRRTALLRDRSILTHAAGCLASPEAVLSAGAVGRADEHVPLRTPVRDDGVHRVVRAHHRRVDQLVGGAARGGRCKETRGLKWMSCPDPGVS